MYRSTLHAPAALLPGKEPPLTIGYAAGWATEPVSTTWTNFLPLSGLEEEPG
jgi:hypothetical protein